MQRHIKQTEEVGWLVEFIAARYYQYYIQLPRKEV